MIKQVEIFSGTGGVGKTTLATARANYLSQNGLKVLLITIDPARRLKQVLGIDDKKPGDVVTIENLTSADSNYSFDALLMSPDRTFEHLAEQNNVPNVLKNRILKILTKPYGGLNEILSIVELNEQIKKDHYDTIVLDTPPGPHFLDFLESTEKIQTFFDQTFVDIFSYLNNQTGGKLGQSKKVFTIIVSTGIRKLLSYLQKVTGAQFVEEFMEAVGSIYSTKQTFLKALNLQRKLKKREFSNWFLVTSAEQSKFQEALELQQHATHFIHQDNYTILNRSQKSLWENWDTDGEAAAKILQDSFINRETMLTSKMQETLNNVLFFSEVLAQTPLEHVVELTNQWKLNAKEMQNEKNI